MTTILCPHCRKPHFQARKDGASNFPPYHTDCWAAAELFTAVRVAAAIDLSQLKDRTVEVHVHDLDSAIEAVADYWDYDTDHTCLTSGSVDIWGTTDNTPAGQTEWRLMFTELALA